MNKLNVKTVKVFGSNDSIFGYHAWPSICRGPQGELLAVCSGKRLSHLCPYGKVLLSRSFDEGLTWTPPETVIDTPLDDRDAGVNVFGKGRLIVNSFNHYINVQKNFNADNEFDKNMRDAYFSAGRVTKEHERLYQGSTYVISDDNGRSWSNVKKAPVSAPHGPSALPDGSLLYMGNPWTYDPDEAENLTSFGKLALEVWHSPDGETWEKWAEIDSPSGNVMSCEANMLVLSEKIILGHIRVQNAHRALPDSEKVFCIYQTRSSDGGHTWTKAERINDFGSPPHLMRHSSGALITVFGHRRDPMSEHVLISRDLGDTWGEEAEFGYGHDIDLGYPASVELKDGSIFTVYYQKENKNGLCEIFGAKWRLPE